MYVGLGCPCSPKPKLVLAALNNVWGTKFCLIILTQNLIPYNDNFQILEDLCDMSTNIGGHNFPYSIYWGGNDNALTIMLINSWCS